MANFPSHQDIVQSIERGDDDDDDDDDLSDYGTDPDDTVYDVLAQAHARSPKALSPAARQEHGIASIAADIEDIPIPLEHEPLEQRIHVRLSRLPRSHDNSTAEESREDGVGAARQVRDVAVEVEYDERNREAFSPAPNDDDDARRRQQTPIPDPLAEDGTKRSMLHRFRTKPKKPLSVTDLVSPAWCEQQYEYNLLKFGRKPRTAAMRQGSSVHQKLEEQVHQVVPVQTVSKEDKFALRILNTIEGLRALREDGLTREMELFGVVEGEVVIGIVDEISTRCPDEEMEEAVLEGLRNPSSQGKPGKGKKPAQLLEGQQTLKQFLTSSQNASLLDTPDAFTPRLEPERPRRFYIKDVKTRQSPTVPSPGAGLRPTHMQLMLYHRLLTSLATNQVPADAVFDRYGLEAQNGFSDRFIAEIANLKLQSTPTEQAEGPQREDPLTELLNHNNLSLLWTLMITEFARTFPPSPDASNPTISPLLVAEFRSAVPRRRSRSAFNDDSDAEEPAGSLLGQRCFPFEAAVIDRYIRKEMAWWKGERATVGVEVDEAFKCRLCEFAEECVWRKTKVEEGLRKAEMRRVGRGRSEI